MRICSNNKGLANVGRFPDHTICKNSLFMFMRLRILMPVCLQVINVYMELLKERELREPKKVLKCHFFNTFFYNKVPFWFLLGPFQHLF